MNDCAQGKKFKIQSEDSVSSSLIWNGEAVRSWGFPPSGTAEPEGVVYFRRPVLVQSTSKLTDAYSSSEQISCQIYGSRKLLGGRYLTTIVSTFDLDFAKSYHSTVLPKGIHFLVDERENLLDETLNLYLNKKLDSIRQCTYKRQIPSNLQEKVFEFSLKGSLLYSIFNFTPWYFSRINN